MQGLERFLEWYRLGRVVAFVQPDNQPGSNSGLNGNAFCQQVDVYRDSRLVNSDAQFLVGELEPAHR